MGRAVLTGTQPCSLWLQRFLLIYRPDDTRVRGNEQADRLTSTADITSGLLLDRAEELRLVELSNDYGQARASQHSSPDGKRSGERKWSTFHPPRSATISVQPDKHWRVSRPTLGRLLRDGTELVWAFRSSTMPSGAGTGNWNYSINHDRIELYSQTGGYHNLAALSLI